MQKTIANLRSGIFETVCQMRYDSIDTCNVNYLQSGLVRICIRNPLQVTIQHNPTPVRGSAI